MKARELEKAVKGLHSSLPLLGPMLQRKACRALAADSGAETMPHLAWALTAPDAEVRATADAALRVVRDPAVVDRLCAVWAEGRDATLGVIIAACGYVARQPAATRVLSALQANQPEQAGDSADAIPPLVAALADRDVTLRQRADAALRALRVPAAIDRLCAVWAKGRDTTLDDLIAACRYVAKQPLALRVLTALKSGRAPKAWPPDTVPVLVECLTDTDTDVRTRAEAALRALPAGAACDALCAAWAETRAANLGVIVVECHYVASAPPALRVLTQLKVARLPDRWSAAEVPLLVDARADRDDAVRAAAEQALRELPPGQAREALCEIALRAPDGAIAKLCLEAGHRPAEQERLCLFLFVTRQLDAYFGTADMPAEDNNFQYLRLAYEGADAEVRELVMTVIRSGDRRCQGFFGEKGRQLTACTDDEIRLALDTAQRHQNWPQLFRAVLDLPLRHSLPLFPIFRASGWAPDEADTRSVYTQLLTDTADAAVPRAEADAPPSSAFAGWLAKGRDGEFATVSEAALLKRLETAPPPDGVPLVAALAQHVAPNSAAAQQVLASPHWLVRLAGHACGLSKDLARDTVDDTNYWVRELAQSTAVLDLWPARATPADLEALQAAPAEAWAGKLGAVRRALRTLLAYRVTAPGALEDIVIRGTEFDAGGFEEVV